MKWLCLLLLVAACAPRTREEVFADCVQQFPEIARELGLELHGWRDCWPRRMPLTGGPFLECTVDVSLLGKHKLETWACDL